MEWTAQVIVVGAGPAGSAAAASLSAQGVDTLLLDRAAFPREKTCGDGLTPPSVAVLQELGLLPKLEAAGALRTTGVRIFAPGGRSIEIGFDELAGELPAFGLTIPRRILDALLLEHAQQAGARFVSRFHVDGLLRDQGAVVGVKGKCNGQRAVARAPLTCLATGAGMPLVLKAGLLPAVPPVSHGARAYYDLPALDPVLQLHFDRSLLPGYGWIFPLSGGRANVGVGSLAGGSPRRRAAPTRQLFERFVSHNAHVQGQLAGARRIGPVRSYPLRTDLAARTQTNGLLLVGEAAGLANPVSGEGVHYALESGLMAAQVAAEALLEGDLTSSRLAVYGRRLHERYASGFRCLGRVRRWYLRERVLDLIVQKAQRRPRLKYLLANAVLGLTDPGEATSLATLAKILF